MGNGWTEERRKKQAEAIRKWKPWEKSTGPRTEAGKERTRLNACGDISVAIEANKMLRGHRIYLTHLNRLIKLFAKLGSEK